VRPTDEKRTSVSRTQSSWEAAVVRQALVEGFQFISEETRRPAGRPYIVVTYRGGSTQSALLCTNHGLYGSTSCCISHGPCQRDRVIFNPHSSETPKPIFMKLEIYNYFPDTTTHAKFQGAMSTWVVWPNRQFHV